MSDVNDFTVVDGLGSYDREANPQGLSVWELLPKEVSWSFLGRLYKFDSSDKLIPQRLIDGIGIALVVSPFNAEKNKALVVKPGGEVMWDVSARANALTKGGVQMYIMFRGGCVFL
ncbi:hypothetical protein D3C84_484420 [compost metagenome]